MVPGYISYLIQIIANRPIWPFNGTLLGTISGQSRPGSNGNEAEDSTLSRAPEV